MSNEAAKTPQLDAEEHIHLAMRAIQRGQDYPATAHLKQAIALDPENGLGHYLLAAQHAQLGMFERAEKGMRKALELAPDIMMARLQLGMLLSARGETDEARGCFERIGNEPESDPLRYFGRGLLALLDEDVETCERCLKQGMELNRGNPALNMDMQRVLMQLGRADDQVLDPESGGNATQAGDVAADTSTDTSAIDKVSSGAPNAAQKAGKDPNKLFLSIYGKQDKNDPDGKGSGGKGSGGKDGAQ